jgi:23S rRNA (cytosine1962-C5)-methyltransferase
LAPGTLVEVYDREGRFVGRGIYNRNSQIAVRLLTEDPAQPLDEEYLGRLLDRAVRFRRETLSLDSITDSYRVVHSEGDGLSGLVVDRMGRFLVIQLCSAGWFRLLRWLMPALHERFHDSTVLVRADKSVEGKEGFRVRDFEAETLGEAGLKTVIREGGLRYAVDLWHGHKTGFFCDQRENRLRVRGLAAGKRVLDGFCYTGGFALNAALGGALHVVAVDLDEKAVDLARENARANRLQVDFQHADMFELLRQAARRQERYDLVILDPPKFAAGPKEIRTAFVRYRDINCLACKVLAPGATFITCSCSGAVSENVFREAVLAGAKCADVPLELLETAGAPADHPVRTEFPQGRYLKVLTFRAGDRSGSK